MAETVIATALEKQIWLSQYYEEYIRESGFKPYMGRSPRNVIHVKYELQEEGGKTINIPLVTRLKNAGVLGAGTLDGNEEALGSFNMALSVDWRRNGVRIPKSTSYKTEIDLWNAAKDMLRAWEAEKLRNDLIEALGRVEINVNFGASAEATRDAWLLANSDRVLFGALIANSVSNDHSTSLATLDDAADSMRSTIVSLAKRMAKQADPHIRPYKTSDGREYFVMFMGSRSFRDLKEDNPTTNPITLANREARAREGNGMDDNPIFQDGDLLYDGVIIREIPEIDTIQAQTGYLNGTGAGAIDVRAAYLCGAQALAIAWGQEPTMRTDLQKDYQFRPGVAVEELLDVEKIFFASGSTGNLLKQHGVVTVYAAALADA